MEEKNAVEKTLSHAHAKRNPAQVNIWHDVMHAIISTFKSIETFLSILQLTVCGVTLHHGQTVQPLVVEVRGNENERRSLKSLMVAESAKDPQRKLRIAICSNAQVNVWHDVMHVLCS